MNSFLFFLSFILLNPRVLCFLSQFLIPGKVGGSGFFSFSIFSFLSLACVYPQFLPFDDCFAGLCPRLCSGIIHCFALDSR